MITFTLLVAVCWLIKAPTLLLIVGWYAASGPVLMAIRYLRERRNGTATAPAEMTTDVDQKTA